MLYVFRVEVAGSIPAFSPLHIPNNLRGDSLDDARRLWWNFSLMRKYPAELQPYGVLNFSIMVYEVG
jgi:hypothetical protein